MLGRSIIIRVWGGILPFLTPLVVSKVMAGRGWGHNESRCLTISPRHRCHRCSPSVPSVVSFPRQAEVDVNTPFDVSSLVSSADLPVRERQGQAQETEAEDGRERFYLTTAINYTNGRRMYMCTVVLRSCLELDVL